MRDTIMVYTNIGLVFDFVTNLKFQFSKNNFETENLWFQGFEKLYNKKNLWSLLFSNIQKTRWFS